MPTEPTRRPIAARETRWASALASILAKRGVRPNTISEFSVVCAIVTGVTLLWTRKAGGNFELVLFVTAALFIPARLLCNMLDGMVAIEGGLRSKTGELYNEVPDRISDAVVLVCAGHAADGPDAVLFGWTAALLAIFTAYVRALGVSAGARAHFCGPMAKQQRMVLLAVGCLAGAVEAWFGRDHQSLRLILLILCVGCVVTVVRRLARIKADLESS
jgi:phosphatidylglycerophosphate synthase